MTQGERISQAVEKFKRFNSFVMYISVAGLFITFILDSLNPLCVKLLKFNLFPFQKELIEELLVIIVWLPFAYVLIGPGHIVTDILRTRMGRRLGFVADVIVGIATIAIGLLAFLASLKGTFHSIQFNTIKMGEIQFSLIPFYIFINIAFFLFLIAGILLMLKHLFAFKEGNLKKAKSG
jgi:TRAP-type mannitol/chloroaromatic compound transport system permease small subunit